MAGGFHPLRVADVERLTDDAVAVTFEVPPSLREAYRYTAGQHVAVRLPAGRGDGAADARRTYSLCSPAPGPAGPAVLRVGVRLVEGGEFSTYANKELAAGDVVEVMVPAGRFGEHGQEGPGHYAAIAGGSGITPVLSLAATLLARDAETRFCLVRSDRTVASAMFLDEVADLKDRYPDRLQLVHVLTREETQAGLPSGRLDADRLAGMLPALLPVPEVAGWFLCGPLPLLGEARTALHRLGVDRGRIHQEVFHVGDAPAARAPRADAAPAGGSRVAAVLDGRSGSWASRPGEAVLDTVLRNRPDAPFACKGGVCGTCRAFLVSGTVHMDRNYALEPDEVDAGYVLACQSHPTSPAVELDFDR
jgi:ring-1,2-phenylacetyl-CoA epoxidase subunit PaaE